MLPPVREPMAWFAKDRLSATLGEDTYVVPSLALEEVAALCGCSLATAKRRIAEAQRILQEALGHV